MASSSSAFVRISKLNEGMETSPRLPDIEKINPKIMLEPTEKGIPFPCIPKTVRNLSEDERQIKLNALYTDLRIELGLKKYLSCEDPLSFYELFSKVVELAMYISNTLKKPRPNGCINVFDIYRLSHPYQYDWGWTGNSSENRRKLTHLASDLLDIAHEILSNSSTIHVSDFWLCDSDDEQKALESNADKIRVELKNQLTLIKQVNQDIRAHGDINRDKHRMRGLLVFFSELLSETPNCDENFTHAGGVNLLRNLIVHYDKGDEIYQLRDWYTAFDSRAIRMDSEEPLHLTKFGLFVGPVSGTPHTDESKSRENHICNIQTELKKINSDDSQSNHFLKAQSDSTLQSMHSMITHLNRNNQFNKKIWDCVIATEDTKQVSSIVNVFIKITNALRLTREKNVARFLECSDEQRREIANELQKLASPQEDIAAARDFIHRCDDLNKRSHTKL